MSRIEETFARLNSRRETALITFLTAGDPSLSSTEEYAATLIEAGADILELGLPFSDPIADGPVIQEASVRALKSGTTPMKVLECVDRIKLRHDVPVVLLTYFNPIFHRGVDTFLKEAGKRNLDGIVVPDLPIDEVDDFNKLAVKRGINSILLATPTTSEERLEQILAKASGFLYLVSVTGVTGARDAIAGETLSMVRSVCLHAAGKIPVAVGFGISKPDHVRKVKDCGAAGVIVGSVLVRIVDKEREVHERLAEITSKLKMAAQDH